MIEKDVVVNSDAGIHARPAMMIVREAMKYPCEITLIKDNIEADGKVNNVCSWACNYFRIKTDNKGKRRRGT